MRGRQGGRGGGSRRGGGRGRGHGRYTGSSPSTVVSASNDKKEDLDVDKNVSAFFTGDVSVEQHIQGQEKNRDRYAAAMVVLEKNGVEIAESKCTSVFYQVCFIYRLVHD